MSAVLEQHQKLTGIRAKEATTDRGYREKKEIDGTKINIPQKFNQKLLTAYQQKKLKKQFKRRAAIEPKIGHLKTDHRLARNFYKDLTGDSINVLLAAAAMNLKRMMNIWNSSSFWLYQQLILVFKSFFLYTKFEHKKLKMSF